MESWTLTCGSELITVSSNLEGPEQWLALSTLLNPLKPEPGLENSIYGSQVLFNYVGCTEGVSSLCYTPPANQYGVDIRIWSQYKAHGCFPFLSGQYCVTFARPIIQRSWFQMVCFSQESLKVLLDLCPIFFLSKVIQALWNQLFRFWH